MKRAHSGSLALRMIALLACGASCNSGPADSTQPATAGVTLAVPGRANAHVSLAADGMFVAAAWAAAEATGPTDIFIATSRDGGATFTSPVLVSTGTDRAHASGEQPPRVALVRQEIGLPGIVVVWIGQNDDGTALMSARSDDGGVTFGAPHVVEGSAAAGNRGWQAIAARQDRQVAAVWLDHRLLADASSAVEGAHRHGAAGLAATTDVDSVAMAQRSQLYFGAVDGAGPPRALTGGVCYCCKTTMAIGADGAISIAWRHVYDGNMRDIAFTRSIDGGKTFAPPVRVSEDRWSIAGCPDDGPVLAIDGENRVHVVWPTVVEEGGESRKVLFHALTRDGRTFTPRVRIPTEGHASHPQIAIDSDKTIAVIWDEARGGSRRIATARGVVGAGDAARFERADSAGTEQPEGVYPVVVSTGEGHLLRAWTSGEPQASVIRVVRKN